MAFPQSINYADNTRHFLLFQLCLTKMNELLMNPNPLIYVAHDFPVGFQVTECDDTYLCTLVNYLSGNSSDNLA